MVQSYITVLLFSELGFPVVFHKKPYIGRLFFVEQGKIRCQQEYAGQFWHLYLILNNSTAYLPD